VCTGVRSSVILDGLPGPEVWSVFNDSAERVVTVTDMFDGRLHVACFTPVDRDHPDLRSALRDLADSVRRDLESLRG
jgi:hypothetical protein